MKPPHKIILIQHSLDKADQALKTAEDSLDKDILNSQNRAYYAIFYAALALAYNEIANPGRNHQRLGRFQVVRKHH
jgi:uncharacterized protein (UPF0332 family)